MLLEMLGVCFAVCAAEIDESAKPGETATALAARLAGEKAAAAVLRFSPEALPPWTLAADTVVFLPTRPAEIFGKPSDRNQAKAYLTALSGQPHAVVTAFALRSNLDAKIHVQSVESRVIFRTLSEREINAYLDTNDWTDKAGAYGIQDKGTLLVERVEGSLSNVVGLPLTELLESFRRLKIPGWWLSV